MNMGIGCKFTSAWDRSYDRVVKVLKKKKYFSEKEYMILLNFGEDYEQDEEFLVLNRNTSHMRNKIKMNRLLDKLGISHPKTYYHPFVDCYPYLIYTVPDDGDCVVKSEYGERGQTIRFNTFEKIDNFRLSNKKFVQEFIPFEKEYRVVVDFFGVIGIKEKVGNAKLKNSSTCKLKLIENKELGKFAVDVARKMEIDFTGMDVGEYDGKFYVIELNSAPAMCKKFASKLAKDLISLSNVLKNAHFGPFKKDQIY